MNRNYSLFLLLLAAVFFLLMNWQAIVSAGLLATLFFLFVGFLVFPFALGLVGDPERGAWLVILSMLLIATAKRGVSLLPARWRGLAEAASLFLCLGGFILWSVSSVAWVEALREANSPLDFPVGGNGAWVLAIVGFFVYVHSKGRLTSRSDEQRPHL